jgi:hypothetical protein
VPDIISTVLARALVMLVEALLTRMLCHLLRSGLSRQAAF